MTCLDVRCRFKEERIPECSNLLTSSRFARWLFILTVLVNLEASFTISSVLTQGVELKFSSESLRIIKQILSISFDSQLRLPRFTLVVLIRVIECSGHPFSVFITLSRCNSLRYLSLGKGVLICQTFQLPLTVMHSHCLIETLFQIISWL
jgi:hypothetical protein